MASNLCTFKQLLAAHVGSGKPLPNVILADGNELGQAFSRLVMTDQPKEGETPGDTAARYLDEICASLGMEENQEACKAFEETVGVFTTKIKNAWDTVSAIRDTGRELAGEMERICSDQVSKNEFVSKHLNYNQLKTDFPVFSWDGTKIFGSITDVIKTVNSLATADKENVSEEINADKFNIITLDMSKFDQIEDVNVSEESRQAAIDSISALGLGVTAGDIENVVDAVTGINKNCPVVQALSSLKDVANAQIHLFSNIKLFDSAITSFVPVLDVIISEQVDPIPASKEIVIANAKRILTVLQIAAYYEYMQRTTAFRESILLQGGLVNEDQFAQFKEAGGTVTMLAEFIRFMYADDASKIPVAGIKIKPIIDGAAAVSERVKKDIANVEGRVAIAMNLARSIAFKIVIRDYFTKQFTRKNEGADPNAVSAYVADAMAKCAMPIVDAIQQYHVNFVDASMNAIVNSEYKGSFTEHLFKELGAAYISATEQNGNITAQDLRQVDVSVIAKLICKFVVDNLVVVSPVA